LKLERVLLKSKRTFFFITPCSAVHFVKSEDSDLRFFNYEPDIVIQIISKQVLSRKSQSVRKGGMYIVDIDIAKRFHEAAIIDSSGKIIVKRIRFTNSHTGFLKLMDAVRKLNAPAEFGMEATRHYQMLSVDSQTLVDLLQKISRGRFGLDKANEIRQSAKNSFGIVLASSGFSLIICQYLESSIATLITSTPNLRLLPAWARRLQLFGLPLTLLLSKTLLSVSFTGRNFLKAKTI